MENKHEGDNFVSSTYEIFIKYQVDTGCKYYCPFKTVADKRVVSEWEIDNCVEPSTVGRYSGNLHLADRFTP